jgi:hypothetical protein
MSRAAAEIEPLSRMLSSKAALPGPVKAPDSNRMVRLTLAMPPTILRRPGRSRKIQDCINHSALMRLGFFDAKF